LAVSGCGCAVLVVPVPSRLGVFYPVLPVARCFAPPLRSIYCSSISCNPSFEALHVTLRISELLKIGRASQGNTDRCGEWGKALPLRTYYLIITLLCQVEICPFWPDIGFFRARYIGAAAAKISGRARRYCARGAGCCLAVWAAVKARRRSRD
jgi:hypothetical protein